MISKIYKAGKLELHHFDFYRLQEAGIVGDELAEQLHDPHNVVVVEWAQPVNDTLPEERIRVTIRRDAADDEKRLFEIEYPEAYAYVVENL